MPAANLRSPRTASLSYISRAQRIDTVASNQLKFGGEAAPFFATASILAANAISVDTGVPFLLLRVTLRRLATGPT
jgi:hypothetical protein